MTRARTEAMEPYTKKGKPRCQHPTREGRQCLRAEIPGTGACDRHGSGSPQAERVGAATTMVATFTGQAIEEVTDPYGELAALGGQLRADEEHWRAKAKEIAHPVNVDNLGKMQIHPLVEVAERATDRRARYLLELARLDLVERMSQLDVTQGEQLLECLLRGMGAVGMAEADQETLLEAVAVEIDRFTPTPTRRRAITV